MAKHLLKILLLWTCLPIHLLAQDQASTTEPSTSSPPLPLHMQTHWAADAAVQLQTYYGSNALWADDWWQSANALTALIDYMEITGRRDYMDVIEKTFERHKGGDFLNFYFDDEGWWGLVWIRAFDLTRDWKYMESAQRLADDMNNLGWDGVCNGGIYWNRDKKFKATISTELFIKLSAALHNRIGGDTVNLDRAITAWNWLFASGLVDHRPIISDRLTNCVKDEVSAAWTYNQGVILGGGVELFKATGNEAYLDQAEAITRAVMHYMSTDGIIIEATDASCGSCMGDERWFKGIFMRNLRELYLVRPEPDFAAYIQTNAYAAYENARSPDNFYGFHWQSGFDRQDHGRQTSALDLMNALYSLPN